MAKKIYFRADASPEIGYGHFIRCLALADMLKDDFECVFFTQTPSPYQRQEVSEICQLVELPSSKEKFEIFLDYLSGDEIVVLDNYFYTSEYQIEIKEKGCSLVCVDDMHDRHYFADIVINHGLSDSSLFDTEPKTRLCLGFEWALLRRPFLTEGIQTKEKGHWLVSFGGSDYYNLTEKFLSILDGNPEINKITAIIGDGYRHTKTLEIYPNVQFLKSLSAEEMCDQMRKAEYAILPSSGICIEALACGCKVLSGYYADNQIEFYRYLKNSRNIYPLDNLLKMSPSSLDIKVASRITIPNATFTNRIKRNYVELFKALALK